MATQGDLRRLITKASLHGTTCTALSPPPTPFQKLQPGSLRSRYHKWFASQSHWLDAHNYFEG
eukprot:709145-Amphidinium_carterae.1